MATDVFKRLYAAQQFERQSFPFLETWDDLAIVVRIGYHQESGKPISLKQLQFLGIASVATVQRRLRRLKLSGAVQYRRCREDARAVELVLSAKVVKLFAHYADLVSGTS